MQKRSVVSLTGNSKCALKASYLVARRVAQSKKPFPIAEELVLPAAVDMCCEMIGEAAAKKLLTIPLSNDTVSHRITDMASDIQHQLLERIKSSPFYSLHLDEYTDVTNAALLLVFVRYRWDSSLHEDILFCGELPTRVTAQECFFCMDNYFTENGLDWQNCVGVCSDGAASMTGRHNGVVKQILDRAPEAKWTHCFLHRESLAAKNMSPEFHEVMDVSVKTINFIKSRAVNSGCFAKLCEDMEADHVQLLYHSEVQISESVSQHLSQLAEKFDDYFPEDPRDGHMWILDPFSVDPTEDDVALPSYLESQLLEVSTDSTLKLQWGKLDLGSFWIAVSKEYPCLALRAVKHLLPFTTTYLCESGFSSVATTKTKARNRLGATLEATLRVSLSPIPTRLDLIVFERQAQVSH
ncbi:SCAN domain-containing protein 3-like [Anarhichas minor]|uniref:SCAN domain-containing protein 3-like n=1 Tax=Anarhichas minor TaxID=65739 RepID=UPI003F73934A